jgi:hypothetical protein
LSGIVKGISKLAKNIVGGVKKVFKAVTGSTLGKALLLGAMIYMGGAAIGAWESPFASVNGALAGTEAAAAGEGVGAAESSLIAGGEGAAEAAGAAEGAAPVAASAPTAAEQTASQLTSSSAAAGAEPLAATPGSVPAETMTGPGGYTLNSSATGTPPSGIINRAAQSASWFSKLQPITQYGIIQAGAGAVKAAYTPSPAEEAQKALEWRNQFLAPNFNVSSVNVGAPANQVLKDASGNPVYPRAGIISSAMKR